MGIRGIKGSYKKHERGDMEGSCVGFKGDISLWQVQLGTGFSNGVCLLVLVIDAIFLIYIMPSSFLLLFLSTYSCFFLQS